VLGLRDRVASRSNVGLDEIWRPKVGNKDGTNAAQSVRAWDETWDELSPAARFSLLAPRCARHASVTETWHGRHSNR